VLSPRTGLGLVETALLDVVAGAGRRRSDRVLGALEREHGIGPRYGYEVLTDLVVPWRLHLPLLEGRGNLGSQYGDPPADATYTEVQLSAVGALAVAAERAEVGPVPLGLIEGSLYRGGEVPPFGPARVIAALQTGARAAGPPSLPAGGVVAGPVEALLAGRKARLQLGCDIVREPGQLVLTHVPLGVDIARVTQSIVSRIRWREPTYRDYLPEADRLPLPATPVRDLRDETSMRTGIRVVCTLAPGADPDEAEDWLRQAWPVTIEIDCRLPAPMSRRLRTWDRGDGSGLAALAALL